SPGRGTTSSLSTKPVRGARSTIARIRSAKGIADHDPFDLASMAHVFREQLAAPERARSSDDRRVPVGQLVGGLDGQRSQHHRQPDVIRIEQPNCNVALARLGRGVADRVQQNIGVDKPWYCHASRAWTLSRDKRSAALNAVILARSTRS